MSITLSSEEIFALAGEIEKSGFTYYSTIAETTTSTELRDLFTFLANEEIEHHRVFENLGKNFPSLEVDELAWGEIQAYIKATTDRRFFIGEDKAIVVARNAREPEKALEIALDFEKDTILFFHELLDITPKEARDAAASIVAEEKHHVRMLSEKLDSFQPGK